MGIMLVMRYQSEMINVRSNLDKSKKFDVLRNNNIFMKCLVASKIQNKFYRKLFIINVE